MLTCTVSEFLADHGVAYTGGAWESGGRRYPDLRVLLREELLLPFLAVYGIKWPEVEKYLEDFTNSKE